VSGMVRRVMAWAWEAWYGSDEVEPIEDMATTRPCGLGSTAGECISASNRESFPRHIPNLLDPNSKSSA
jgi:hypothetical protein